MALVLNAFNEYRIWYYSARQYNWRVNVQLYDNASVVGRLLFVKEGVDLPDNRVTGSCIYLYYPIDCFDQIMEILRREAPLYVALVDTNLIGYIGTADFEPVGDEESEG